MDSPDEPTPAPRESPAPRGGLILMAVILGAMALLAIYSNVQKARRPQIETVTVTPAASPSSSPVTP
jgi:hypothetical protein